MRKIAFVLIFLILNTFISGCYESELPLSKPSSKVDLRLINSWVSIPGDKNDGEILLVFRKFNENEYLIAWKEGNDETLITRGFVTRVRNTDIINVQNINSLEKKERTYLFFRYNFKEDGNLVVSIISDDFPGLNNRKFKTSKALKKFVRKNMSKKGFFGEEIAFKVTKEIGIEINP